MYYFASDMHLGLKSIGLADREKLLVRWLDEVSADAKAIYLLGDVFDFWYEYKRVIPKGFSRFLGKLSELTDRGVEIHFFAGNHDMWAYDYLHTECGVTIHTCSAMFTLYGKEVYMAHGDRVSVRRRFMGRVMNNTFRNKSARWTFSRFIHPDLAMRFGHWWSESSRKSKSISHKFFGEAEPLVEFARDFRKSIPVDYFLFGHIHCAEDFPLDDKTRVIFLGEWLRNPTYAVMTPDGDITLKQYKP